jgi:hypothetical protein
LIMMGRAHHAAQIATISGSDRQLSR